MPPPQSLRATKKSHASGKDGKHRESCWLISSCKCTTDNIMEDDCIPTWKQNTSTGIEKTTLTVSAWGANYGWRIFHIWFISLCNVSHGNFKSWKSVLERKGQQYPLWLQGLLLGSLWDPKSEILHSEMDTLKTQRTGFHTGRAPALDPLPELTWIDTSSLGTWGDINLFIQRLREEEQIGKGSNFFLADKKRTALQTIQQHREGPRPLQSPEIPNTQLQNQAEGCRQPFSCLPLSRGLHSQTHDFPARCSFQDPKEGNLFSRGERNIMIWFLPSANWKEDFPSVFIAEKDQQQLEPWFVDFRDSSGSSGAWVGVVRGRAEMVAVLTATVLLVDVWVWHFPVWIHLNLHKNPEKLSSIVKQEMKSQRVASLEKTKN